MFDVLSNQSSIVQAEHIVVEKPPPETELTLEQVFAKLDLSEYKDNFIKEGIDMDSLVLCTEDDLKVCLDSTVSSKYGNIYCKNYQLHICMSCYCTITSYCCACAVG